MRCLPEFGILSKIVNFEKVELVAPDSRTLVLSLPTDERFPASGVVVWNADNAFPIANKIIVGSQAGFLRMYHPTKPNFRIEDLVLEEQLGAPILQVNLGRFIPGSELLGVAILHPRELVVYEILPQAVKDDRVSYYSLRKAYGHDLGIDGKHFTAFNMTYGPFGGVRGRDMILVQSMDGKLQIFEQSAHAFTRQFVDCLLPGPLTYVPKIDSFVTVTYGGVAECYRYQVLASSQSENMGSKSEGKDSKGDTSSFGVRAVRNTLVEWATILGESCRQVLLGSFLITEGTNSHVATTAQELLFVGEKSLFLVKAETGGIIQQRRIDRSDPSCACLVPFVAELGNGQTTTGYNFLLADQEGTVQVYAGFNLVWAARLTSTPVYMNVSSFGGQRGLIVVIDETGFLSINYMGTKPPTQTVLSQVRDLDYDKIDEEHRQLLQVIRDAQNEHKHESQDRLLIKTQVPKQFDLDTQIATTELPERGTAVTFPVGAGNNTEAYMKVVVRLYVTYTGAQSAQNVSLVISSTASPAALHITPKHVVLDTVSGARSTPTVVKVTFFALKTALLSSMDVTVTASYQSPKGETGITTHPIDLPFFLAIKPRPPTKTAAVKVVLDTEYPAVSLLELFQDVLLAYQESTGADISDAFGSNAVQAVAFQLLTPVLQVTETGLEALQMYGQQLALQTEQANAGAQSVVSVSHNKTSKLGAVPLPESSTVLPVVSILASKNAGRYRVQADSFPALALVLNTLESRLSRHITAAQQQSNAPGASPVVVTFEEPLTGLIESYLLHIAEHLQLRHVLNHKLSALEHRATQYRMVEKRLLVRFKDKNPASLGGLDVLLQESYQEILHLADEVESIQRTLAQLQSELDAFSRVFVTLVGSKLRMPHRERSVLLHYLTPTVASGAGSSVLVAEGDGSNGNNSSVTSNGWEETVQMSLQHLLKTTLSTKGSSSGSNKGHAANAMGSGALEMPKNVDGLRKALTSVLDRLEKGGRLLPTTAGSGAASGTGSGSHPSTGANTPTASSTSAAATVGVTNAPNTARK